jgi:hypothetical protein
MKEDKRGGDEGKTKRNADISRLKLIGNYIYHLQHDCILPTQMLCMFCTILSWRACYLIHKIN